MPIDNIAINGMYISFKFIVGKSYVIGGLFLYILIAKYAVVPKITNKNTGKNKIPGPLLLSRAEYISLKNI